MKEFMRTAALRSLTSSLLSPLHRFLTRDRGVILSLHRFSDPDLGVQGHCPDLLRSFLDWLRARRIPTITLDEMLRRLGGGEPLRGAVSFTVDDGYLDFVTVGIDAFSEFDCPVTVFLPTGFVDRSGWMWWDKVEYLIEATDVSVLTLPRDLAGFSGGMAKWPLETRTQTRRALAFAVAALKPLPAEHRDSHLTALEQTLEVDLPHDVPPHYRPLDWDQVRACSNRGATFGPHTESHPWLPALSDEEAAKEIHRSWDRVQEEVEDPVPVFCYPYGTSASFSTREEALVQEAGLAAAVSAVPGMVRGPHRSGPEQNGLFRIPRFGFPNTMVDARQVVTGIVSVRPHRRFLIAGGPNQVRDNREGLPSVDE